MSLVSRSGLSVVVALTLAACGAGGEADSVQTTGSASAIGGGAATSGVVLTDEMRLMLGTMKLDEVGLEPDAAQASDLLVLWQAYRSLATSDTAAPQEIEAVLGQIEKTMTAEQVAAIAAMDLDQEDLSALLESSRQDAASGDGSFDGFPGGGPGGPGGGAAGGFAPPGGGAGGDFIPPDGGAGPASGGFGGSDSGLNPEMQATAQAGRLAGGGAQGGLFLLRPLIAELQALAASE
jgi:hypothetical protein